MCDTSGAAADVSHPRRRGADGHLFVVLGRFRAATRIGRLAGPSTSAYFDRDYFAWQGASAERSARAVVPLLLELVRPASVVDVGCGTGAWLQVTREHGVEDVVGVDGDYIDRTQLRIPPERFHGRDLSQPRALDRTFDLALSLEAAHYLPPQAAPRLVAAIAAAAPVALFSAAIPAQGGGPGLNRQWPSYWAGLFREHGFSACDWLRPRVWEDERVDWWYAQNAVVYVRSDRLEPLGLHADDRVLPLVHPIHFLEVAEQRAEQPESPPRWLDRLRGRRAQ